MLDVICMALMEIQEDNNSYPESLSKGYALLSVIEKCSFVTAMTTLSKIFIMSHHLLTSLQAETIDLVYFLQHAT